LQEVKEGEGASRGGEDRLYRELFDNAPVSLWEEDFSGVASYLEELRSHGVEDLRAYLQENTGALFECMGLVRVTDVNRRTLELYGAADKQEFFKGLPRFIPPEAHPVFAEELQAIWEGKSSYEGEVANLDLRGNRLWLHLSWVALPGPHPEWSRVAVSMVDLTERRRLEEELRSRRELLEGFMAQAAHELRHPAALLDGYSHTLAEYGEQLEEKVLREVCGNISGASRRLIGMVEELLESTRASLGVKIELEPTALEELLSETARDARDRFPGREFELRCEAPPGTKVTLDRDKVRRALVILLENAVKYSPDGSPLELEGNTGNDGVTLSVYDRGVGVPEEERERVFERFYRSGMRGEKYLTGLGLGLHIARETVRAHGGRIWCEGRPGGGSVFRIFLPATEPPS
jgi:signal transduction histidine kinase